MTNTTDTGPRVRVTRKITNSHQLLTAIRRWFGLAAPRAGRHRAASSTSRADKTLIPPAPMDRQW